MQGVEQLSLCQGVDVAYLTGDQQGCVLLTLVNRSAHLTLPNKQVYDLALPTAITAAGDLVTNRSQKGSLFPERSR